MILVMERYTDEEERMHDPIAAISAVCRNGSKPERHGMIMKEENDRSSGDVHEGLVLLYAMPDGCIGRDIEGGPWFYRKKKGLDRLTQIREN
jgi:hypothetical protein